MNSFNLTENDFLLLSLLRCGALAIGSLIPSILPSFLPPSFTTSKCLLPQVHLCLCSFLFPSDILGSMIKMELARSTSRVVPPHPTPAFPSPSHSSNAFLPSPKTAPVKIAKKKNHKRKVPPRFELRLPVYHCSFHKGKERSETDVITNYTMEPFYMVGRSYKI